MQLTIHRGTREIGGSCVELATATTRVVLDAGLPLVDSNREPFDHRSVQGKAVAELLAEGTLPKVAGLFDDGPGPDAVLLSHAHLDHAGLLHLSRPQVPVHATRGTSKMMLAGAVFSGQKELDRALRRGRRRLAAARPRGRPVGALAGASGRARASRGPFVRPPVVPGLIRPRAEVEDRRGATARLMRSLGDRTRGPETMCARVMLLFERAQEAWAARPHAGRGRDGAGPVLPVHPAAERLREQGVVNRLEQLSLGRVELIAADARRREVAVLVTFQAVSWYEDERTGAMVDGSRDLRRFQEVWAFRHGDGRWRLARIEPSAGSPLLRPAPAASSASG